MVTAVPFASAQVQWEFTYTGNAGVGFNAPGQAGLDRQNALVSSATALSNYLVGYNVTIQMNVISENVGTTNLASAGSPIDPFTDTGFLDTVVQRKIQTGVDLNGGDADGTINWNWDYDWSLGRGANAEIDQFDFQSTAMHELIHAMGFSSQIDATNGTNGDGGLPNYWAVFDQFLENPAGIRLVDGTTFEQNLVGDVSHFTGGLNADGSGGPFSGVYFAGPNAMAANGGNRVEIYTPSTLEPGSTGSHLDQFTFTVGGVADMMTPQTPPGDGPITLAAVEIGILKDLGYNVVPEPGAFAFFLSLGVLMAAASRRRRVA